MMLDCDLLIGRDRTEPRTLSEPQLRARLGEAGISGGALASLRALLYDPPSGNAEIEEAARAGDYFPVYGVYLRNPLEAEAQMELAAQRGVPFIRLAPGRQGIGPAAPRLRILARKATELGLTLLVEGSTLTVGIALMGLGASVVFLDQHFYDAGEFVQVARDEPGFHTSTRMLGSPEAWDVILKHCGAERLVLGTRAGWFEEQAVLEKMRTVGMTDAQRHLVTEGNLRRLAGAADAGPGGTGPGAATGTHAAERTEDPA